MWPENGLEHVESCPVCGLSDRHILHSDLVDEVFGCAPGEWSLWRCDSCRCGFLDPRPSLSTQHLAYTNYYTHSQRARRNTSCFEALKRTMVNGYATRRFGAATAGSSRIGVFIAKAVPFLGHIVDRTYRHLPLSKHAQSELLDVGCGNGDFLKIASKCGWRVFGVDFDSQAVSVCSSEGLNVREGGVESLPEESEAFDYITLSHVLEHVGDPNQLLQSCYRLLRPGGSIWLETPNIDSLCHGRFGRHWRGLEAPRHLVLFNAPALERSLTAVGFRDVTHLPQPNVTSGIYRQSRVLAKATNVGLHPFSKVLAGLDCLQMLVRGFLSPPAREFILVKAVRPRH